MRFPRRIAGLLSLVAAACSSPAPEPGTEPMVPPPRPVAIEIDASQELPAGVLAMSSGKFGPIVVDEQNGMRRLVIDGEVMGAVPIGDDAGKLGPDPVVAVVEALAPKAKTALVIGLGTGKTAADLSAAGLDVTVVEIEPAVIEYAKKFFGYQGEPVRADGARFVRRETVTYDVVLMDAFRGMQAPYDLVSKRSIALMRERTSANGLTIIRGLGEPRDHLFTDMARRMRRPGKASRVFVELFGSGVGAEPQNLYLIASGAPISVVGRPIPVWPVRLAGDSPTWAEPKPAGADKRVELIGYVVRLTENGALALDMPHWEMGAVRYLLTGEKADKLAAAISKVKSFPTAGDIPSDGATDDTLYEVLGGGGAKRSDVRFSPLAAIVRGTVRLKAVVDPDAAGKLPAPLREGAPTDPLLPYGGALYELEVGEVRWTLDRATWKAARKKAAPLLARAVARIGEAEIGAAANELALYVKALEPTLMAYMPPRAEVEGVIEILEEEADRLPGELTSYELATACDRAHASATDRPLASAAARTLADALADCALAQYEEAAADHTKPNSFQAGKRLLYLYDQLLAGGALSASERAAIDKKRARMARKYRDPDPNPKPPEAPDEPPATPPE
jgi:hypothetical protein